MLRTGYWPRMPKTPEEQPEDKDLQDHTFGMNAARQAEAAEKGERTEGDEERRAEPHAGGKA